MTISTNMFDATVAVVAVAGTSVVPTLEIPDNCHTVVILNPDATNTVLVGMGAAGGALPAATSAPVPTQSSLSLVVGPLNQRASAGTNLVFDTTAGAVNVNVIYVNGVQS